VAVLTPTDPSRSPTLTNVTMPRCGLPPRTPGHWSSAATWTDTHAFRPTRPESGIDHRVRDHGDHRWADLLGDSTRLTVDRSVGGDSRRCATGRGRRCGGRRTDPVVVIVELAVRGVGFVVVRFMEPQHVWDLGIGAVRHERITIGAGDGREGNRSTDRGCRQPRCD